MKQIHFFIIILLLFCCLPTRAQKITSFHGVVSNGYNFWVYTPADADSVQKPLILFLHGASLSGKDLNRVLRYGPLDPLRRGRKIDAVIVAPQSPGGGWNPQRSMNIVEWVKAHYNIDTNRFYVIGMSMGGYGTIEFTGTYPDKVAAAMAFCGGANLRNGYCGLNQVPLWILHGTADRDVHIRESEKVVNSMKQCGPTPRLIFTRLQGVNHGGPARAFYLAEPYEWLFSHNLQDPDRKVNKNFSIPPAQFHGVYDHLTRVDIPIVQGSEKSAPKPNPEAQGCKPLVATTAQDSLSAMAANNAAEPSATETKTQPAAPAKQYHKVKQGETLGHIARKYHTSVKRLCQLNGIKETTPLQIGKRLRVK